MLEVASVTELRPESGVLSSEESHKPWRACRLGFGYRTWLVAKFGLYAWLMLAGGCALAVVPLAMSESVVWWGVVAWVLAVLLASWAGAILSQFPRKQALVRRYRWMAREGRFSPADIAHLCGDPCYRLVADEILRFTPHSKGRKALIRQLNEQQAMFGLGKVTVDPERGVLVLYNGK